MNFKCVDDQVETTTGFFTTTTVLSKIDGLTKDRVYVGAIVSNTSGGQLSTSTTFQIIVWDDNKEWCAYNIDRFEPV